MGGYGSGTWYRYEKKCSIDQTIKIDIRYLKRNGMLQSGNYILSWKWSNGEVARRAVICVVSEESIAVLCRWTNDSIGVQEVMSKTIRIAKTACSYGNWRQWLVCPHCCRRMAVLVIVAPTLACRHCLKLSYSSQNENYAYRQLRKRNKIQDRLGFSDDSYLMNVRPKGMHRKTFEMLVKEMEEADMTSLFSMVKLIRL